MNIEWKDGELTKALIYSKNGNTCTIRTNNAVEVFCDGKKIETKTVEVNVISFNTMAGAKYIVQTR